MNIRPRFRLFAGPNGSGKTTLFQNLKEDGIIHTEIYVNADRIEAEIKERKFFYFNSYRVKTSESEFKRYVKNSGLFVSKINDDEFLKKIVLTKGVLKLNLPKQSINSYHASFIAAYLAEKLIETGQSFCFETVMSHPSKAEFLGIARKAGYKTYLYFLFTESAELNIERVKLRVKQGLHNVSSELIRSRYLRSFANLPLAIKNADVCYIIDTSSTDVRIVAEKDKGRLHIKATIPTVLKPYLKK